MTWLITMEPGYMALGYDDYYGDVPVWHMNGEALRDVALDAVLWTQEAIEVDGNRRVLIYYVTDDCKIAGPDMEIRTGKTIKGEKAND